MSTSATAATTDTANNTDNTNIDNTSTDDTTVDTAAGPIDSTVRSSVEKIPLLTIRAGPRDGDLWINRLKQEYSALIKYVQQNKRTGSDWFEINPINKDCTSWSGRCWFIHNFHTYTFILKFDIPVTYPTAAIELILPELDGRTSKMYRGGAICLSAHFKPIWAKNVPHFGIAQALALGLGPWLAAEIPHLVSEGQIDETDSYKTITKK